MLSKVKLYGELADFCGGRNTFEAVINKPIDAVNFLRANFAGLEKHMVNQFYEIYIGEHIIDKDLLDFPSGGLDIKIIPVVAGSGNVGKIIAGVALLGFAFMTGGSGILGAGLFEAGVGNSVMLGALNVSALAGKLGLILVLSGVAGLLTPTPELPDDESDPIKIFFLLVEFNRRQGVELQYLLYMEKCWLEVFLSQQKLKLSI